jgi:hypothetical protein
VRNREDVGDPKSRKEDKVETNLDGGLKWDFGLSEL